MLLGVVNTNAQEDVTLTMGRLVYFNELVTQNFTIKNNTAQTLKRVHVNCGFFSQGQLIGIGIGIVTNLPPNAEGYNDANLSTDIRPDNVRCRVDSVE